MESPDEYLGRLHFPAAGGVGGHRGGLVPAERWKERVGVFARVSAARSVPHLCGSAAFPPPEARTHTDTRRGLPPSSAPIDFVSVSLYCDFISVVSADGGEGGCVCVLPAASDEPFLSGLPLLVMLAA